MILFMINKLWLKIELYYTYIYRKNKMKINLKDKIKFFNLIDKLNTT